MGRVESFRAVVALLLVACLGASCGGERAWPRRISDEDFWGMVVRFSEPDGVFQPLDRSYRSDNLVSSERSLQHVIPRLQAAAHAGAYLGVGPEQNFVFITALRPTIAFIVDIRRQNMLLHLMYKALLEISTDRIDFLSRLFARQRPANLDGDAAAAELFTAFEHVPASDAIAQAHLLAILDRLERVHRFELSDDDRARITSVYRSFVTAGPGIRWDPEGGAWIPSFADLMVETDGEGHQHGFLASEAQFRILKGYQARNLIVPLVGDFGGGTALRSVGRYLHERHDTLATFYASNVQGYLRGPARPAFLDNVAAMPLAEHSTLVRTMFRVVRESPTRPDFDTSMETVPLQHLNAANLNP